MVEHAEDQIVPKDQDPKTAWSFTVPISAIYIRHLLQAHEAWVCAASAER